MRKIADPVIKHAKFTALTSIVFGSIGTTVFLILLFFASGANTAEDEATRNFVFATFFLLGPSLLSFGVIYLVRLRNPAFREKLDAKERKRILSTTVRRTWVVGTSTAPDASDAIGRAIIGNAIAGDLGAILGACSSEDKVLVHFCVEYLDGHQEIEVVEYGSQRYDALLATAA